MLPPPSLIGLIQMVVQSNWDNETLQHLNLPVGLVCLPLVEHIKHLQATGMQESSLQPTKKTVEIT